MDINRYCLNPKMTADMLREAGFKPGSWMHGDIYHCMMARFWPLYDSIELHIDFDLTTCEWDDFENVMVMDDDFGQPFTPFYRYLDKDIEETWPFLDKVITKYNERMDALVERGILIRKHPAEP